MKRVSKWVAALMIAVLVFTGFNFIGVREAAAAGPQGIQFGRPIDDSGNILITNQVAQALADSGAGFVRLNFRLGPYTSDTAAFYSTYDTIVNRLRSKGLQVIGLISNESWPGTQSDWTNNNAENTPGGDGYNNFIDQFGYLAGRMAGHYDGVIKYWEIWNEPNCWGSNPSPGVYTGCSFIYPSNFAAMLGHVYTQMKYYNNYDVEVISGGIFGHDIAGYSSGGSGADYLSDTYYEGTTVGSWNWIQSNAGSYPLDHIGQHIYIDQGGSVSTTQLNNYINYVHSAYAAYEGSGTTKKIFMTEIGWTTDAVSEAVQASNITAAYNVMKASPYIQSGVWFYLQDEPSLSYGIFKSSGLGSSDKKTGWTNFRNATAYEGKLSGGTTNTNILNYFNSHGGMATNGSPYDNGGSAYVHYWDYGYVQDYDGGSIGPSAIMTSGSGTFQVRNGFWQTYLQGTNHTYLQFPTSDEFAYGSGTRQNFQGGYMTWDPMNGIQVF
ncbi:hypothetical protein [Paenibacillus lignilyticus]|uniref:Glycoside hydrolase family 5 domain-containing protein n=1 Tax=Paenibacillus lignilyticus TaxID=1172615 RepID=A0ABS5CDU1_9BACL|nr:hypothetical protein [Paenibacillus lignilyticus]MBP3964156.1 hypothetical protein [Paenibacillus lignilyticus]